MRGARWPGLWAPPRGGRGGSAGKRGPAAGQAGPRSVAADAHVGARRGREARGRAGSGAGGREAGRGRAVGAGRGGARKGRGWGLEEDICARVRRAAGEPAAKRGGQKKAGGGPCRIRCPGPARGSAEACAASRNGSHGGEFAGSPGPLLPPGPPRRGRGTQAFLSFSSFPRSPKNCLSSEIRVPPSCCLTQLPSLQLLLIRLSRFLVRWTCRTRLSWVTDMCVLMT